jgi:hypothetical protein
MRFESPAVVLSPQPFPLSLFQAHLLQPIADRLPRPLIFQWIGFNRLIVEMQVCEFLSRFCKDVVKVLFDFLESIRNGRDNGTK